jgi:hypothetical protein
LATTPTALCPTVSIIPAAINTIAYSFISTSFVSFVRRIGKEIKNKLPTQAAKKISFNKYF